MSNQVHSGLYAQFRARLERVANEWREDEPETQQERLKPSNGIHGPYVVAAKLALARIANTNSSVGQRTADPAVIDLTKSAGVDHGLKVMFAFCHNAALTAAQAGVVAGECADQLRGPGARALACIASSPNRTAVTVEAQLNLAYRYPTNEHALDELYQWRDGKLALPILTELIVQKNAELILAGDFTPGKMCRAQRAGHLEAMFGSVVDICMKDLSLIPATYSHKV